jgi:hypothetical protein
MAKKPTPRVSPSKGMTVDAWVKQKATGWQQKKLKALLDAVQKAAPDAELAIKWGQPVFSVDGPLAFLRPAKAHVTLGFWRGAELSDPDGVLEGEGARMKHWKLGEDDARWVREACELNRSKGDPTKR